MGKTSKKCVKQCTLLDVWEQKGPQHHERTVKMPSKCSRRQESDEALKKVFGHAAYKSDVQEKVVSTILAGYII